MKTQFTPKEIEDIKRALVLAMKDLDEHSNKADKQLADRLEQIYKKL